MTLVNIPEPVRRQACLSILDTVGCVLAGTRTEEAALLLVCEPATGDRTAAVFGTSERRSLQSAVRINGYLGDVLELNDLIGGHASIGNVSAALALGEAVGASGAQVVEAVVRGIEVTTRVYESVYPSLRRYTEAGLVPVGIPSTIGCAAAAAHLLQLDEGQTAHALAIAGGLAGWCPAEVIFGQGGTVKPLLFGAQPADVGITAAHYARAGMSGPADLLDSRVGYFATVSTDGRLDEDAWNGRWALAQPRRKLHACCGYLHAPADALARLRAQAGGLRDADIVVSVSPYVADVVSKDRLPISANDARFHLQYCLALVAAGADVILPEHSIAWSDQLQRAELPALMKRIRVVPDESLTHYHHCRIDVTEALGRVTTQTLSAPRGSPQDPLQDEDVVRKFHVLAEPVLGAEAAQQFSERATALNTLPDVRPWLRQLEI